MKRPTAAQLPKLPHITLERNNAGAIFVGLTEFDGEGMVVRACVLTMSSHYITQLQGPRLAEKVIRRRFDDIVRLAGDHATSEDLL